jgi:hypothetical protein
MDLQRVVHHLAAVAVLEQLEAMLQLVAVLLMQALVETE